MNIKEIDKELTALTLEYKNSFPEKYREIDELKQQLEACEWQDSVIRNQLYQLIHKLTGSAGSYGFDEISARAFSIGLKIKAYASEKKKNISQLTLELEQLLKIMNAQN